MAMNMISLPVTVECNVYKNVRRDREDCQETFRFIITTFPLYLAIVCNA